MNLNLLGVINDRSYGLVCLNFLDCLTKRGIRTSFFPIIGPITAPEHYGDTIRKALSNQDTFDSTAPSLRIWHPNGLAEHVGRGKHIGYTIFELDRFNERELHHMRACDQIITCSKWGRDILAKFDIKADVVPLGVDPTIFFPANSPRPEGPTIFAHYGKWEIRKGVDILQVAFNRAFTKKDNVKLRLHCWNPFLIKYDQAGNVISDENKMWKGYFENSCLGDKIEVAPWLSTQVDIANSMRSADCGVFPARAEGWNLELLEMMACGKHVITTNYSGHTEFADKFNSSFIEVSERESAFDGVFFHNQGEWAAFEEDQIEQLVEYMKAYHQAIQNGLGDNLPGLATAKAFTWDNAVKKLVEAIAL